MVVSRTMGAMASVVLLWGAVVSTSVAGHSVEYRCQDDGDSYTQQVMVGPSRQVSSHNNGRLQETFPETKPGSANSQQVLAAFRAHGLSTSCVAVSSNKTSNESSNETANNQWLWPDKTLIARVHFAFDNAGLTETARTILAEIAPKIRTSHQLIVLEGHTDSRGAEAYNQLLGQQRADSVAEFLTSRGIAPEQLVARSQGEMAPVRNNLNSAGQLQNRRVDIIVRNLKSDRLCEMVILPDIKPSCQG